LIDAARVPVMLMTQWQFLVVMNIVLLIAANFTKPAGITKM
jgi:hypothetical protein